MKMLILLIMYLAAMLQAVEVRAEAAKPETVIIRGESLTVWPRENLVQRGFDIPDVPRDQNAAWVYIDAANKYVEVPPELSETFDYAVSKQWPTNQAALAEFIASESNREAIALAEKASRMDRCVMPRFGDPNGSVITMLLPNLSSLRHLAKLLVADGHRLESEGKYDEALLRYQTVLRMGQHLSQGSMLIESLVGLAVWNLGNEAITNLVLRHEHSASWFAQVQKKLEEHATKIPNIESGLEGESAIGPGVVDEICASPFKMSFVLSSVANGGGGGNVGTATAAGNTGEGWARLEKRVGQLLYPDRTIKKHLADYYDLLKRRAKSGLRDPASRSFNEEKYINDVVPKWDVLTKTLLPALAKAQDISERTKANAALAYGAVALRRYAVEHEGKQPEKLADAVSTEKQALLTDPFSGSPLIHRRTTDGWTLYSIGLNQKDDGGQTGDRWDRLDMVINFPPQSLDPFVPRSSDGGNQNVGQPQK